MNHQKWQRHLIVGSIVLSGFALAMEFNYCTKTQSCSYDIAGIVDSHNYNISFIPN